MLNFDSTYKQCFKCIYFSRDTRNLVCRKKFKFLKLKYWWFLLSKLNFWSIGRCQIAVIDENGEHINAFMRGYETCLFENVEDEIINVRDFIGKLPNDPKQMEEAIRKVEQKHND